MLLEIRAEIAKLLIDLTFVRNLSCVFLIVFASCYGLFELQSQNENLGTRTSMVGISRSNQTKIIFKN